MGKLYFYVLKHSLLREINMGDDVVTMNVTFLEEARNAHRSVMGKTFGNKLFGRPTRKWDDNMKMDTWEMYCIGSEWNWLRIVGNGEVLFWRFRTFGF